MKRTFYKLLLGLLCVGLCSVTSKAQVSAKPMSMPVLGVSNPWSNSQLLEPAELAASLKSNGRKPVILNIGAAEDIEGATHIGAVTKPENMEKLQKAVAAFPKNAILVIYCGCCPFDKCPNIRPAFLELEKLGFTHIKVLDLPVNLKTNWVANGYPVASE
jgi:hypothetical protein